MYWLEDFLPKRIPFDASGLYEYTWKHRNNYEMVKSRLEAIPPPIKFNKLFCILVVNVCSIITQNKLAVGQGGFGVGQQQLEGHSQCMTRDMRPANNISKGRMVASRISVNLLVYPDLKSQQKAETV